jgi:tripartite motif-containing protein 71
MNRNLYVRFAAIMLVVATGCQQAATPVVQVPTSVPVAAATTKVPPTALPTAAATATAVKKEGSAIPCAKECEWVINDVEGKIIPTGFAINRQGNLVVLDNAKARYLTFSASGKLLPQVGKFETPDAALNQPLAVAIDSRGNIYLTDPLLNVNSSVLNAVAAKFDAKGKFIQMLAAKQTVISGGMSGLAVDAKDNVYVADYGGDMVCKFDNTGKYLSAIGSPGKGDGQIKGPLGLAVDSSGMLYVTDLDNNRIDKFDSAGKYAGKITSCGTDASVEFVPISIAFDVSGNVYVKDDGSVGVCKYDATGKFISRWGSAGKGDGQFGTGDPYTVTGVPYGIAIDKQGNIYVGDQVNQRIMKFAPR